MLLGALFGIPYSFKKVRTPTIRFFQRQTARFSAFAQRQQTPPDDDSEEETRDDRDYEEGEVIDLDAAEGKGQVRTTTARQPHMTSKRNKKQPHRARAALALTHA